MRENDITVLLCPLKDNPINFSSEVSVLHTHNFHFWDTTLKSTYDGVVEIFVHEEAHQGLFFLRFASNRAINTLQVSVRG